MTIGIGFICEDGIVLAADIQYTAGDFKSPGRKLFPLDVGTNRRDLTVVAVGAGRVSVMTRAIEELAPRLAQLVHPCLSDVRVAIEDVLRRFFKTHIDAISPHRQDQSGFELLLGAWTGVDGFGLFTADDAVVSAIKPEDGYASIGDGRSVSDYALRLIHQPGLRVESAKFSAALCIKAAKDHVVSCGGPTTIHTLVEGDGSCCRTEIVSPSEVTDLEQYSEELFEAVRIILMSLDSEEWEEEAVGSLTEILRDSIVRFRNKQIGRRETRARQEAAKLAAQAKLAAKATPPGT